MATLFVPSIDNADAAKLLMSINLLTNHDIASLGVFMSHQTQQDRDQVIERLSSLIGSIASKA